jgi:hypothetical protein
MTFEDAGHGNERKWQCFICGMCKDDYQTYKDHILETHDEGREYLKCPDCQAPVRDMKAHYQIKHPNRVLPTGIQTRVTVWFDRKRAKDGNMKMSGRRPNNRQGTFCSRKMGMDFDYKSGLECDFLECLESDMDVDGFLYEAIKIPYYWRGDWHEYTPDVKVRYSDGSIQIWEVKPANQTTYDQNTAKWAAANNFCANLGWEFIVMTEVGLGKLKAKVKRQQSLLVESPSPAQQP